MSQAHSNKKLAGDEVSQPVSNFCITAPYSLSVEDVLTGLSSSRDGLSAQEAQHRLDSGLISNSIQETEKESLLSQFLGQFQEPLILLLLGSAVVSFLLRQYDDAICITVAIILVCTVSFVQEYNSEKTIEALKNLVVHSCVVVRNRRPHSIAVEDLVPGDVVIINAGDRIPADVRFIEATDLTIDESMLTGEAKPCRKVITPCPPAAQLYERNNSGFMGSVALSGYGKAVVTSIGNETELGKMASEVEDSDSGKSPLQKDMAQLGQQLSVFSFGVIVVICIFGFFQGNSLFEMFTVGVSLAVAAIPEGLPIVTTVTLALGCQRMARRKALIRKLPAVEALGATSVICSDKTGTLTRNEMTVRAIYLPDDSLVEVPTVVDGPAPSSVAEILNASVLCSNASLDTGAPTERAIVKLHDQYGLPDRRRNYQRLSELPFSSDTKWMATEYQLSPDQPPVFFAKGSPEVIFEKCKPLDPARASQIVDTLSRRAYRVLAIASGSSLDELQFLGLVGMSDPPRDGVREAVTETTRNAGIRVVMITGDSEPTALAIATELGIVPDTTHRSAAMSGSYLQDRTVDQLANELEDIRIFYRVTPSHKRKIVECLQRRHVVAMTGDGVNDAPALKKADVGIAMGSGQDVAKEAAEVVLVNDNFVSITAAVEEGRSIYNNIRNFLRFQLTTSVAAMACIAACTVLKLPMPLNATQILLINIIMDGPPAQSLGLEPSDIDVMTSPPRDTSKAIVSPSMIFSVITSACIMIAGTVGIFRYSLTSTRPDAETFATTIAFTTFVLFQAFNALNCRSPTKSVLSLGTNPFFFYAVGGSILAQVLVTSVPFLQYFFETVSLSTYEWGLAIAVASSIVVWDEVRKLILR